MNKNTRKSKPSPAPADEAAQFRPQTILIALRYWWKVVIPLGILLGVGAGAAMFYSSKPVYTAAYWLIIRERPHVMLTQEAPTDMRKFVENQLELIKSPRVIDEVVGIAAVASTPELRSQGRDPASLLRKQLKIRALGRSDYFVIEFTSVDREKAALIVNKVAEAYLDLQRSTQHKIQSLTIGLLDKELAAQQTLVERYRSNVRLMTKQLTGTEAFPAGPSSNRIEIRTAASELESKLIAAEVELALWKAKVEAEKGVLQNQSTDPSEAEILRQVEGSEVVLTLVAQIESMKAKLKDFERVSTNFERNAAYQRLKSDLKIEEERLVTLRKDGHEAIKTHLRSTASAKRDTRLTELDQSLSNAQYAVQFLTEKVGKDKQGRKAEQGESLELEFARADYERSSAICEALANRCLTMRMEQRAPSQVEQFEAAKPPSSPDGEPPYKKMLIVALGAMFLPWACAVAIEHFSRRVTTRDQLESMGGVSVVGEITTFPRRRRPRGQHESPNRELQLFEESIDGLRTYLKVVQSLSGMQTLAVTSAVSREGKTSLAAQLAISLASATGQPTLLIDGDMRSPDIHRAFDQDRGPGLVEVLRGQVPVEEAIREDFSDSLHVLTAGCLDVSPHSLLGASDFAELIAKLKGRYAHIVIDTPPLLAASESLLMACVADATILCARRDFSRVHQTIEAYSRLRSAGVKIAGAVLNGIPTKSYVYRYGSYYHDRNQMDGGALQEVAS